MRRKWCPITKPRARPNSLDGRLPLVGIVGEGACGAAGATAVGPPGCPQTYPACRTARKALPYNHMRTSRLALLAGAAASFAAASAAAQHATPLPDAAALRA